MSRETEIGYLSYMYGTPIRRQVSQHVTAETFAYWSRKRARREEVVLFLIRENGFLLLHTKGFYPPDAFRVPSGGVKAGEALLDAAGREAYEETGLCVQVDRFLAIVDFVFWCDQDSIPFRSNLFLLHELSGQLKTHDVAEGITEFREIPVAELPAVAHNLEHLPSEWSNWGAFRAVPHRLAAEVLLPAPPRAITLSSSEDD